MRQGALALAINSSEVPRRVPTLGERSVFCTSNLLPVNYWEANTKKSLLFLETIGYSDLDGHLRVKKISIGFVIG